MSQVSQVRNDRKNYLENAKRKISETKQIASNISYASESTLSQYVYNLPNLVKNIIKILEDYLQPRRLDNNLDEMIQQINGQLPLSSDVSLDENNRRLLRRIDDESITIIDSFNSAIEFNSVQEFLAQLNIFKTKIRQLNDKHGDIETYFHECLTSVRGAAIGVFLVCDDAHEYYRREVSIDSIIVGVRAFINAIKKLLERVGIE